MKSPLRFKGFPERSCRSVTIWLWLAALTISLPAPGAVSVVSPVSVPGSPTGLQKPGFPLRDTSGPDRVIVIAAISGAAYGGTLLALDQVWYSREDQTTFHTFNDNREWLQVDKIGHGWTAYTAGWLNSAMWRWAGLPARKAAVVGTLTGLVFLTGVEYLDAHSAKWGWSWGDIAANLAGSGLFLGQELLWSEQRIQYKFSFHGNRYKDPMLQTRADDLFGSSWSERMLKDYNAQTYWLSVNPRTFLPDSGIPGWLNVSVGYGAGGMFGGFRNQWIDPFTQNQLNRSDIRRTRQFYLSPDIDLSKILSRLSSRSRLVRTGLFLLNSFKFPAPALMIDSRGRFRAYALYF